MQQKGGRYIINGEFVGDMKFSIKEEKEDIMYDTTNEEKIKKAIIDNKDSIILDVNKDGTMYKHNITFKIPPNINPMDGNILYANTKIESYKDNVDAFNDNIDYIEPEYKDMYDDSVNVEPFDVYNNKSAMLWALDEVIDSDTDFEGSTKLEAKEDIIKIVQFIKDNNIYHGIINIELIDNFFNIMTGIDIDLKSLNVNRCLDRNNNYYIACGWPKHNIFVFYEKNADGTYQVGVINAGQGSEIQGINGSKCNGILIFQNVTRANLELFLNEYKNWYIKINGDDNFKRKERYVMFYMILHNLIDGNTSQKSYINYNENIKAKKIIPIEINSQILGSCTFTNNFSYIIYMLYKKLNSVDVLQIYQKWYQLGKKALRKALYNNIITKNIPEYNIYKYIYDIQDVGENIKRNERYEEEYKLRSTNIVPIDYNFTTIVKNIETINRDKITIALEHKNIFWDIIDNNGGQFISYMRRNTHPEERCLILDRLFTFYSDLYTNSYGTSSYYFLELMLELYKLKKYHNIQLDFNQINNMLKSCLGNIAENYYYKDVIYLLVCIYLSDNKGPEIVDRTGKRQDIFEKIIHMIPIPHGKYNAILKDFIQDLKYMIKYLPYFDDTKKFLDKTFTLSNESYKSYIYNKLLKGKQLTSIIGNIEFKEQPNYRSSKNLLVISLLYDFEDNMYNSSITNNAHRSLLFQNSLDKCDIFYEINDDDLYPPISSDYINTDGMNYFGEPYSNKIYQGIINNEYNPPRKHLINLLFPKYLQILIDTEEKDFNEKIYFKYIVFFYMCMLQNIRFETAHNDLFTKYNNKFLRDYCTKIPADKQLYRLVVTYIFITNSTLISSNQTSIFLDNLSEVYETIIPKTERQLFTLEEYKHTMIENNKCITDIGFDFYRFSSFRLDYESREYPYMLLFAADKNELESVQIVKELLSDYNYINILYIVLNFNFKTDDRTTITGTSKIDPQNKIVISNREFKYNTYDVIRIIGTIRNDKYRNFCNLMSYNDMITLIYMVNDDEYHIILDTYDLEFIMKNNNIYCTISKEEYEVKFNNMDDNINTNGILELTNIRTNIRKILCFYNWSLYEKLLPKYKNKKFVEEFGELASGNNNKYNKSFYTIIDTFNNKYILKNENDALAILLNCLYYNNSSLLLKTHRQIQILIEKYDISDSFLTNICYKHFYNVYSLPIMSLLFDNKDFHQYNYLYYNRLYKKYNIPIKITVTNNKQEVHSITLENIKHSHYKKEADIIKGVDNYTIIKDEDNIFKIKDINYMIQNYESIHAERIERHTIIDTGRDTGNWAVYEQKYDDYYYNILSNITGNSVIKKELFNYNNKYTNDEIIGKFKKLISSNIPNLNNAQLYNNILISTKLFKYLISNDRTKLYPILELIMGSGKSTSITPYLALLLINHFSGENKDIYIVMPNFLINQAFETIMKNLILITPYVKVKIYNENDNNTCRLEYNDVPKLVLIDDTMYKNMFLIKYINTTNMYMIYDEVDMMANPLTCELNIPDNEKLLECTKENKLLELCKFIYDDILVSKMFWGKLKKIELVFSNGIQDYIINYNDDIQEYVNKYFRKFFPGYQSDDIIQIYCLKNVIPFILTKQYNLDYGIPDNYPENVNINYKFKSIPYSAADSPIYGSQFSDPILSYILTFICYRIKSKNNFTFTRLIDKQHIFNKLIKNYQINNMDPDNNMKIMNLFVSVFNVELIIKNKDYYIDHFKPEIQYDTEEEYYEELSYILNKNNTYYSNAKNISFTDMMLYRNVKNFVCFTGTAYIKPPIDMNSNFIKDNEIRQGRIASRNNIFDNTEKAIEYIINNKDILKGFYFEENNKIIDSIFSCLFNKLNQRKKYNVLIDIGAYFVSYNNNMFIDRIRGQYDYFVYFENGRYFYDLKNNKHIDSITKEQSQRALFYFSNKNITGVDAKDFMNNDLHGLVTFSSTTNLRDFSQGIFRMREILIGQTFDIFIQEEIIDKITKDILKSCESRHCIVQVGKCNIKYNDKDDIRSGLYKYLKFNQDIVEENKNKILYKQNIIGLLKLNLHGYIQQLYIEPINYRHIGALHPTFATKISKDIRDNNFDINDLNIGLALFITPSNPVITKLIELYLNSVKSIVKGINKEKEKQKEKEDEKEKEKEREKSSLSEHSPGINAYFNTTFIYNRDQKDIIIFIGSISKEYPIVVLYQASTNSIIIINTHIFNIFLTNNKNIDGFTVISIYNRTQYGNVIDTTILKYIIIISKLYLAKYYNVYTVTKKGATYYINPDIDLKYLKYYDMYNTLSSKEIYIMKGDEFIRFFHTFKNNFIHFKINDPIIYPILLK